MANIKYTPPGYAELDSLYRNHTKTISSGSDYISPARFMGLDANQLHTLTKELKRLDMSMETLLASLQEIP